MNMQGYQFFYYVATLQVVCHFITPDMPIRCVVALSVGVPAIETEIYAVGTKSDTDTW